MKRRPGVCVRALAAAVAALAAAAVAPRAAAQLQSVYEPCEVKGVVVYHYPSESYVFLNTDEGEAWRIDCKTGKAVSGIKEGARVVARGDALMNVATHQMYNAVLAVEGRGKVPSPIVMTPAEMHEIKPGDEPWRRAWYGKLVVTSGVVRDINRRATYTQIVIGPSETPVMASLPIERTSPLPEGLEVGANVRVSGVGVYRYQRDPATGAFMPIEDIEVRLRSVKGLDIMTRQPFWTVGRVFTAFGIFAVIMFAVIALIQRGRVHDRIAADAIRRERLRLTSELHDNFQQLLAGCMFRLGAATGKIGKDDEGAKKQLELLCNSLNHTQASLRAALWGLTEEAEGPTALSELFRYAASRLPHWSGLVHFSVSGRERSVARKCSGALLLIMQEAVGNAVRHGRAKNVDVSVEFREHELVFMVRDDGCGFDAKGSVPFGHLGLVTMRRHAEGLGGRFEMESAPGAGATVRITVPL